MAVPFHRTVARATQLASWLVGQGMRLRIRLRVRYPHGRLARAPGEPLILALNHERVLDPWLAVSAFDWETWRTLAPVRIMGTQDWTGIYRAIAPLSRVMYRLYGVVELPPRSAGVSREEKLAGLVAALAGGQVAAIFPEGHVREPGQSAVRPFQNGVVVLHRLSGAPIVPMAIRMHEGRFRQTFTLTVGRPYALPADLEPAAAAEWLRERVRELYLWPE